MVIPCVEEITGNFEVDALGDGEVLGHAHIPIVDSGLAEEVALGRAELAQSRLREACRVDALHHLSKVRLDVAAGDDIGALRRRVKRAVDVVGVDSIWEAGLEGCDSSGLPSADEQVSSPVHAAGNL